MGARLVRALANFMLDLHTREHGYEEVAPPYLVNRATHDRHRAAPEVRGGALHASARTSSSSSPPPKCRSPTSTATRSSTARRCPSRLAAYTPCFRREAGAAGKDTRGLIRVHQFDKVELVRFCRPEDTDGASTSCIDARTPRRCSQRLGAAVPRRSRSRRATPASRSARTYDLEVWAPGVGTWLEVSSASTFTDFQARRANIRFRPAAGAKPEFVHTLNASGVAFPRTIIALLENNQQADGSVRVPDALAPYLGTDRLVARA